MDRYGSTYSDSDEHTPVMWLRGYPIYAAHFIVVVYVVSMLVVTMLNLFGIGGMLQWLPFSSPEVLHGQVWRIFTYGLYNPPSLGFVFEMIMIAWFGRDVERAWGRRTFLWFYAAVYLITPLLFTAIGTWLPLGLAGATGAFALFIAFATLYPGALMMFNILAKWAALILVGISTLIALNYHDWSGLISLWVTSGFAYAFVRHHQGLLELPKLNLWKPKPKLRVLPDLPAKKTEPAPSRALPADSMAEVDALLDKIAKSGFASLTAKERAKLDSARAEMLKKNSPRG
ncbi:MAG: rhomboid family intramembrane serine protease [Verrucomicrobia bacterium]|nr:rhomboid family intramembrane serine protease [Verrucomicrobiota bacterium]